jgi:hypothetical protein
VGTAEAVVAVVVATVLPSLENPLVVGLQQNHHLFCHLEPTQSQSVLVAVIHRRSIQFRALVAVVVHQRTAMRLWLMVVLVALVEAPVRVPSE